ncbi:hypothetical protein BDK51DRAFT_39551 [Blyttiomyces helicus]|uniref:Uncharacterized protein n=1 Tax=Blyttiomyces helicus TaxID=388810 RepID=A0A4V1IQL2_9FUNG|nr:hypothetical protein BDK51DRAFT_39551 [Blyttiomyces helicus]|eukprot:RKO86947.1 hypothetical protein BDK51DRAFT_39551 [Blyttiomyces helicus]
MDQKCQHAFQAAAPVASAATTSDLGSPTTVAGNVFRTDSPWGSAIRANFLDFPSIYQAGDGMLQEAPRVAVARAPPRGRCAMCEATGLSLGTGDKIDMACVHYLRIWVSKLEPSEPDVVDGINRDDRPKLGAEKGRVARVVWDKGDGGRRKALALTTCCERKKKNFPDSAAASDPVANRFTLSSQFPPPLPPAFAACSEETVKLSSRRRRLTFAPPLLGVLELTCPCFGRTSPQPPPSPDMDVNAGDAAYQSRLDRSYAQSSTVPTTAKPQDLASTYQDEQGSSREGVYAAAVTPSDAINIPS